MESSSLDAQRRLLVLHELKCLNESQHVNGSSCPPTWDGLFCWPGTPAGYLATAPCPDYVHGFNTKELASRLCDVDGTWWLNPVLNQTWSNYSLCTRTSILAVHIPVIKSISQIGYSISLALLLLACLILGSIRRLRCPRNHLHLQLFASFILRAAFSLIRDMAPEKDADWSCKALTSAWHYCLMANYCWILMEGLYLHNLLFLSLFSDNASILKYELAGWGLPLVFLIPWIAVRATFENILCWTVNRNQAFFWIIRGPITASILLNLFFFLNISRVLFLKMFSNEAVQNRRYKYRKWCKSTLVLVPLFGVHYALLLSFSLAAHGNEILEILWLYVDQTFSSFQGSFVAFLYCFLNGEVKSEIRKLLDHMLSKERAAPNQHNSLLTQSLTYLSKGRASVQSLHTLAEKRDNWKSGELGERPNWAETPRQAESLL